MRPSFDGVTFRWASGIDEELSPVADAAGLAREVEGGDGDAGAGEDFESSEEPQAPAAAKSTASAIKYRIL